MLKRLPVGIQTFSEIREGNWLYVDKTKPIYRMTQEGKYYFFSRPRRFGKSLTLSTLKSLYQGRKDLFEGLWIEDQWDWTRAHPVVHISFSSIGHKELGLEQAIKKQIKKRAEEDHLELKEEGISQLFRELIEKLAQDQRIVLLIDEYDKPIIDFLTDIPQAKDNQSILKSFYSVIKDADQHIELLMITGVSKFSKVSIFSELNNLEDISLDRRFANLVGITQQELEANFEERFPAAQGYLELNRDELLAEIKDWYNGYSWDGRTFVYNPFSILNFFQKNEFVNFWFSSGTPTFLINLLRERKIYDIGNTIVGNTIFDSFNIENIDTYPLLLQTGYLTIKSADRRLGTYTLDYPNKEVKESMFQYLIAGFSYSQHTQSTPVILQLRQALMDNESEKIITLINSLFSSIPYHIFIKDREAYYHSLVFLLFRFLGQYIEAEVNTSNGRVDSVVTTDNFIYILEFKLDESADAAIQQIKQKNYAAKYQDQNKPIIGIGINFSSESKSVVDWKQIQL